LAPTTIKYKPATYLKRDIKKRRGGKKGKESKRNQEEEGKAES
jgi:hypothetical protein